MKITQALFADHIGTSHQAVSKLIKTGILDLSEGLDACRLRYIEHLREQAAGRLSKGKYDLTTERARLAHHQANEKQLQVKKLDGELIPAEQVLEMLQHVIANARAKLLALPSKATMIALSASDPAKIEYEIRDLVYESLNELAAGAD